MVSELFLLSFWTAAGVAFFQEEDFSFQKRIAELVFRVLVGLAFFTLIITSFGYGIFAVPGLALKKKDIR